MREEREVPKLVEVVVCDVPGCKRYEEAGPRDMPDGWVSSRVLSPRLDPAHICAFCLRRLLGDP